MKKSLYLMAFSSWLLAGLAQAVNVTTYHNDNLRTGWNSAETQLTPTNVNATTFGLLKTVTVDEFVDAQPLVVNHLTIAGGTHNVVYVVTRNNTVYAIDATSGAILLSRNLGTKITNNSCPHPDLGGILSTPTIDLRLRRIYLVAFVLINNQPTFHLHALNLTTLADITGSPVTVKASHTLSNGTPFHLIPSSQRQRAALLEVKGIIYAGFTSECNDSPASTSRGWLLGWNATSLAPLAHNELTNQQAPTTTVNYFLASIWMSGYGLAADALDNIYFSTGNGDGSVDTYSTTFNLEESAIKLSPDLSTVSDFFTPNNAFHLDQYDIDFGAGGVLVLPDQPGPVTHLATVAGKDGRLFILNRDDMGHFNNPDVPAHVSIGGCWCGESYYEGMDGIGRVVTSGGFINSLGQKIGVVKSWRVDTSLATALVFEAQSPNLAPTTKGDLGFFTSISSNGTSNPIIWAVGRATGSDHHLTLYAFNGMAPNGSLTQLFSAAAGTWPYANANAVPTVANGKVYVGSNKAMMIFGLKKN